jgi:hypothetical protein
MSRDAFCRRVAVWCFVGILACLLAAPFVAGQSGVVANGANPLMIQLQPPGAFGTTQQPWVQTGTNTTGTITLTQPAVPSRVNYCTAIYVQGSGATAATALTNTLQSGGTTVANFGKAVPVIGGAGYSYIITFNPPIAGLGPGQTMVLTDQGQGAGGTVATATMTGYSQ